MTFRRRIRLSEQQRNDMWRRWKAGQSLHEIGRVFGKDHVSIQFMLAQHGGIAPAVRRRSPLTLTLAERETISRGIACGSSIREIAKGLRRAVSTVSREVARHGGRPLYRATDADQKAWESALRPKRCLLALHVRLQEVVAGKLILDWSPEQVSGWLKSQYPDDESMRVSHETIYRSLFIQARGVLKKELIQHLRFQRRIRRSRHARDSGHRRVKSSTPFPFENGLRKSRIAPSPAIGRAICWAAPRTVISQLWWNDIRVLSCWLRCPAKIQLPWSPLSANTFASCPRLCDVR